MNENLVEEKNILKEKKRDNKIRVGSKEIWCFKYRK